MEQECREFLSGYVRIYVSGDECRRFLNLCAFHGLFLWRIQPSGGRNIALAETGAERRKSGRKTRPDGSMAAWVRSRKSQRRSFLASDRGARASAIGIPGSDEERVAYEACLLASDFKKIRPLARKCRVRVRILRRCGLPFFLHRNRKRIAWPIGILFSLLLMAWLSAHVWSIHIEGNFSQTDDVILEYLEQNGIHCGMWKNQADCQELAQKLRDYFPRFSWTSAELSGTLLTIYVKEGIAETAEDTARSGEEADNAGASGGTSGGETGGAELSGEEAGNAGASGGTSDGETGGAVLSGGTSGESAAEAPTALAAAKSGTVVSIYVRSGLPLVEAGDEVEAGEILVTGALPVYNDDGEIASWQDVCADADIVLRTRLSYYDEISYETEIRRYTGQEKTCAALRIGTWMFSLPDSFDDFETCAVTGVITQARISGQFYLPLYLYRYTAREYETLSYTRTAEETEEELQKNLLNFVKNLEEKGVQIFQNDVTIGRYENSAAAAGILTTDESAVKVVAAAHTEEEVTE